MDALLWDGVTFLLLNVTKIARQFPKSRNFCLGNLYREYFYPEINTPLSFRVFTLQVEVRREAERYKSLAASFESPIMGKWKTFEFLPEEWDPARAGHIVAGDPCAWRSRMTGGLRSRKRGRASWPSRADLAARRNGRCGKVKPRSDPLYRHNRQRPRMCSTSSYRWCCRRRKRSYTEAENQGISRYCWGRCLLRAPYRRMLVRPAAHVTRALLAATASVASATSGMLWITSAASTGRRTVAGRWDNAAKCRAPDYMTMIYQAESKFFFWEFPEDKARCQNLSVELSTNVAQKRIPSENIDMPRLPLVFFWNAENSRKIATYPFKAIFERSSKSVLLDCKWVQSLLLPLAKKETQSRSKNKESPLSPTRECHCETGNVSTSKNQVTRA